MSATIINIIKILNSNENLITHCYKGKDDLTCISEKLVDKINAYLKTESEEEANQKELIRQAVREAHNLHESDIVFFKNDCIFIKFFDTSKVKIIPEEEKGTIAGRYNGLDEDELKLFYDNFCSAKESDDFYREAAREFIDIYIIEKKIDNETYEKYVFQYIQSIINEKLTSKYDKNEIFFKGFSGYVFRIHFEEMFEYIAHFILFEVSMLNKQVIDFLNYYSLNVIVVNGKKYKVPQIKAQSGLKWNVVSMMSIVKIYNKVALSIEQINSKRELLAKELSEFSTAKLSPIEYNSMINKNIDEITLEINAALRRQITLEDVLATSKDEKEGKKLKDDIRNIKNLLQSLADNKKKLSEKLIKQHVLMQYNNIKKDMDSLKRQQKRDEKILQQNEEAYLSIKTSLIKALIAKKRQYL
ncbi:hypothetical protein [Sulfurimonas sp.]|jgi:hypothetical protein|uniref:hypothetical protein n=1 Tax=Sulfurimonas sp. TaxID=2022749 RepID=UPI0025E5390E|nr:hypothetical protein [Sulfurimonas sp.]MCK9472938.1 hypothetical protein [Sulfurimonas sp.]MDD3505010.1 hypothetical protein [Sulfurimonas sp.]